MEEARAQKRRELQSNALVRRLIGGSEEDLKPLTPEELDLLEGRDMEHLIVIDGIVCRLNDNNEIIAPADMAEKYKDKTIEGLDAPEKSKKEEKPKQTTAKPKETPKPVEQPKKDELTATIKESEPIKAPTETEAAPKQEEQSPGRLKRDRRSAKDTDIVPAVPVEQPKEDSKVAPEPQAPAPKVILTHNVEILSPVQVSKKHIKAYFAVAYNKAQHKASYAIIMKNPDNTDRLLGATFETDIATDAVFVGTKVILEEFEKMDIPELTIYAEQDIQQRLRRNSIYIVDGYTQATGDYLKLIKEIAQKKYITVAPRESRLDIQRYTQQIANALCADFAIDKK